MAALAKVSRDACRSPLGTSPSHSECAKEHLLLTIPIQKTVHLASDPVPFLGYLLDDDSYAVLGRTLKRHHTRLKRMQRTGARSSDIAKSELSFAAIASLDEALHKARATHIVSRR